MDDNAVPERKRGSGVKMVYDLLRDEILDLKLAPGSPIDEVQLADRFKMSRTPIREALVRLAGEGLIEFRLDELPLLLGPSIRNAVVVPRPPPPDRRYVRQAAEKRLIGMQRSVPGRSPAAE